MTVDNVIELIEHRRVGLEKLLKEMNYKGNTASIIQEEGDLFILQSFLSHFKNDPV